MTHDNKKIRIRMFKNIINRLVTNWKNIFSKNLSTLQREKATEYLFWELERLCNQDKITKEDYEFTQNRGNVHNDADAIYIMMQKNKLITAELYENLKKIKALKYFKNVELKKTDFELAIFQMQNFATSKHISSTPLILENFKEKEKEYKFLKEELKNETTITKGKGWESMGIFMYMILKKHNLVSEDLKNELKHLGTFDFYESLCSK